MKNVLFILICTIFGMVSCTPIDRCDYKIVIEYRIQDRPLTDTIVIENVPPSHIPSYLVGKNNLRVTVVPGWGSHFIRTIYDGANTVTVEHFDYTITRQFKVSKITGKEIH